MEFSDLIKDRWSVRSFSDKPVEQEKLDKILLAAKYAPTAVNFQPQKIYGLKSKEAMDKINSVCKAVYGAPLAILVCYDDDQDWDNPLTKGDHSGMTDASIVATHMMLEAWNQGIGSVWVGMFPHDAVKEAFNLPDNIKPVMLLPIGYAADGAVPFAKWHDVFKPMDEIIETL